MREKPAPLGWGVARGARRTAGQELEGASRIVARQPGGSIPVLCSRGGEGGAVSRRPPQRRS
jgi:hypothetical protein